MQNNLCVDGQQIKLKINSLVCDAPAKAFICGVKHHTGYFGCSKCTEEGDYIERRVVFPELNKPLRTDDSFKNRTQEEYHRESTLVERLGIGMVSQVPLDYMHLVCLGVTKRLIKLWFKGNIQIKLKPDKIKIIESRISSIKEFIPCEFARKPRNISEIDFWKATEFRLFILYTGIVVLKDALPERYYKHMLCLTTSIRILCSVHHKHMLNYSEKLLQHFVKKFGEIYGEEWLSYNVHSLIHLPNDVRNLGTLDSFSSFKFESYLYKLKQKIKHSGKPLHQIANRLHEMNDFKHEGPLKLDYPCVYKGKDYITLKFENFSCSKTKANSCICLQNGKIAIIQNITSISNKITIELISFNTMHSFFDEPCNSEHLQIFLVDKNSFTHPFNVNPEDVKYKCLQLPYPEPESKDYMVVIPLLHCN
ncbi:hypothetical protein PPYR_11967 [Photinus pyralis]|uniref:DUF4218 domain-containing protein n=3 Tax=Photinus pyralis TaxID=7054 RepID=A0A5N4ACZ8_PHOPY|nr:hypothetical protein PPYR_11967 [Photinus pyralis]